MIAAIHQPDFFPWLGFFNKIANADVWVILDHTENNPRDAFWCRRVAILVNGQSHWLTATLERPPEKQFAQPILDMRLKDSPENPLAKLRTTIARAYGRTPYYKQYEYLVDAYFDHPKMNLSERNVAVIDEIARVLEITTKSVRSSTLGVSSKSTNLLIDITKAVGADTYLCGNGAAGYQQDNLFREAGLNLKNNGFQPTPYPQKGANDFVPGLSVLDALFQVPTEDVIRMVHEKHLSDA